MRTLSAIVLLLVAAEIISTVAAQPPGRPGTGARDNASGADVNKFITRMMSFDTDHDGKLSKAEITDDRLMALFERADTNHDGFVTKVELTAVYKKEASATARGPGGGPSGPGGPGRRGPGGPPGGPDGFGGPGRGGPPPIGQILPPHLQDALQLTGDQRKKLDAIQKMVDKELAQILNDDQKKQLEDLSNLGPGGFDGFGPPPDGPGGPGRPGGR